MEDFPTQIYVANHYFYPVRESENSLLVYNEDGEVIGRIIELTSGYTIEYMHWSLGLSTLDTNVPFNTSPEVLVENILSGLMLEIA